MTLRCAQFEAGDAERPLRLQDVWDSYAAFAGVMERRYKPLINDITDWTETYTGLSTGAYGFTSDGSGLQRATDIPYASYPGAFYYLASDVSFPSSYVVELDYYRCAINLVLFASNNTRGYHVRIYPAFVPGDTGATATQASLLGYHYEVRYVHPDDRVSVIYRQYMPTSMSPLTHTVSGVGTLVPFNLSVSARSIPQSFNSTSRTVMIGVWANDRLLFSVSHLNSDTLGSGFVVYEEPAQYLVSSFAPTKVFENFYISELTDIIESASLDPGETPDQGIKRAQEDRCILNFDRLAGILKVVRPSAGSPSSTLTASRIMKIEPRRDARQVISDVRLRGPFHWVRWNSSYASTNFGHRFELIDNTSLWSPKELLAEAKNIIMRSMEAAHQVELDLAGYFFIEPEDVVSVEILPATFATYLVSSFSYDLTRLTFQQHVTARKYFWNLV